MSLYRILNKVFSFPMFLLAGCAATNGVLVDTLSGDYLLSSNDVVIPFSMTAFSRPDNSSKAVNTFQGQLIVKSEAGVSTFRVISDTYHLANVRDRKIKQIPELNVELVQSGDYIIPVQRGVVINDHPHWEYILEPGRVWQQASDNGYSRAAIPFSLQERNSNCTHNGVMSFLFKSDGSISNVAYQIGSETCMYFKFDMWGVAGAEYIPATLESAQGVIESHVKEIANRLPVKPISQLLIDYPGVDINQFNGGDVINPKDMTVFGFVIDGVNYVGGCETRFGPYPYCEVLDLPSYSLAKTLFAGMGLMYLEKQYPNIKDERIADHVPECRASGNWMDVSFENALDMATGNYQSIQWEDDEWSVAMNNQFFIPETHARKINFACNAMLRKLEPGSRWIYHTSDTYILGTAMNNFLKNNKNKTADSFNDAFIPAWESLNLSPVTKRSLRSYDDRLQPVTGYGLTLHHDDIARMAMALTKRNSGMEAIVNAPMFNAAMQRVPEDRGLSAINKLYRYNNGFWAYNISEQLGCKKDVWLPFMSGYGGINVVMMPNDTVYYYFSDGGKFSWANAAIASNMIKPYCH
jgi:hypothetical protein